MKSTLMWFPHPFAGFIALKARKCKSVALVFNKNIWVFKILGSKHFENIWILVKRETAQ